MALQFSTSLRSSRASAIVTALGSAGYIEVRSGTRPANPATTATGTVLAVLPLSSTAGTVSNGVLTFNTITADASADATGTATWFRAYNATGPVAVVDGSVSTSGSDLNLNSVSIVAGGNVAISSATITEGNA